MSAKLPVPAADVAQLARAVATLIGASFPARSIHCVVNPAAGGESYHRAALRDCRDILSSRGWPEHNLTALHVTERPGHAEEIVEKLLSEATADRPIVIVSIGGDGTHNEVLQAAGRRACLGQDPVSPAVAAFLRLPFGSGNDGADGDSLVDTLGMLQHQLAIKKAPMVAFRSGQRFQGAFNIASAGIDAYVTILRQKFRKALPGSSYRLIADASVLFYEHLEKLGPSRLTIESDAGSPVVFDDQIMLVAFGAGGNRTYGDHLHVLPGPENLCVIRHAGVVGKLRLKGMFYKGAHVDQPETSMRVCRKVTIEYDRRLAVQFDGEPTWVEGEEFPISFQLVNDAIPVLAPARIV